MVASVALPKRRWSKRRVVISGFVVIQRLCRFEGAGGAKESTSASACAMPTMRTSMAALGNAVSRAVSSGRHEMTKGRRKTRSIGQDIEWWWKVNAVQIPGTKNALYRAFLDSLHLSYAQNRLLTEPKPIRLCSAPTGAGKTYTFIEAVQQGQSVFFVVPTQALADDIQATVKAYNTTQQLAQPIGTAVWDSRQTLRAIQEGKLSWTERQADFQSIQTHGGMIIATLEALAHLTMEFPQRHQRIRFDMIDLLWRCNHLVIDEAHTLNTRAFGLLHMWITAIGPRSPRRPLSAIQPHPTTSLVGISWHCNEL